MLNIISSDLKISEFIDAVKDNDKHVILNLAESEAKEAEKISEMKGYGQDYVDALAGLIYFFTYHQKPDGISEEYFQMFRSVCKKLAAKEQLPSDMMRIFDSKE
ncbi:MAG: hypothetical protein JW787_00660 [Sedimentisphaerales bacterium]|nr:hypothetical protein [Sedimentisphaerales bacterium]